MNRRSLLVSGTLSLSDNAPGRFFLAREVRDRCTDMVISVGPIDAMVRINRDLEKVSKAAIGAAS